MFSLTPVGKLAFSPSRSGRTSRNHLFGDIHSGDKERPEWVKNGYNGRSTGTSAVAQIADDFGAPRKSAEAGQ